METNAIGTASRPKVWFTLEGMSVTWLASLGNGAYRCPPESARKFLESLGLRFGTLSDLPEDAEFLVFPSAYEFGKPPDSPDEGLTFAWRWEFAGFLAELAKAAAEGMPEAMKPRPVPHGRARRTFGRIIR